jgi:thiol-disulfide isomerase/thioredoxin
MKLTHVISRCAATTLLAATLFASINLHAQDAAEPKTWEQQWAELQAVKNRPLDRTVPPEVLHPAMTAQSRAVRLKAVELFETNPKNPRRWEAVPDIFRSVSGFIYEVVGDIKVLGGRALKGDGASRSAWDGYCDGLYREMMKAEDISSDALKAGMEGYIYRMGMRSDSPLSATRDVMDEYVKRFPESERIPTYEQQYYGRLQRQDPTAAKAHLAAMAKSEFPIVRKLAESMALTVVGADFDLKFTALDGREVDIAKLRGKVVLVDFWATWCGPCIAEFPNVKDVYERYKDKGFEIVAISLDSERDRQKLIDMSAEKGVTWPQHFDGKGWKNEFAEKYSIRGIPAMFLIDKEGRIASDNARGKRLEAEVKRLLGL